MDNPTGTTEVTRTILARRSVREGYDRTPLPPETVEELVACGMSAPSSKNSQPWRFHVVTDPALLDRIAGLAEQQSNVATFVPHDPATGRPHQRYRSTVLASAAVLREVPCAIFVENVGPFSGGVAQLAAAPASGLVFGLFGYGLEMFGVGAAVQNVWIAAEGLGLTCAFLGDIAIAEAELASLLDLSGDLVGALAVGRSTKAVYPPMDAPALAEVERVVTYGG